MSAVSDAPQFLARFKEKFHHPAIREWSWTPEDDDFGKTVEWRLDAADGMEAVATIDLMQNQVQLTITERDTSGAGDQTQADTTVVFEALVQFEERRILLAGEEQGFSDAEIAEVIARFNEQIGHA